MKRAKSTPDLEGKSYVSGFQKQTVTSPVAANVNYEQLAQKKDLFASMDPQCKLNVVSLEIEALYGYICERTGEPKQTRGAMLMQDY
jgi:hypothetical protein